jgi:hypothetical protein
VHGSEAKHICPQRRVQGNLLTNRGERKFIRPTGSRVA